MRSRIKGKHGTLLSGLRFVLGRVAILAIVVLAFLWLTKGPDVVSEVTVGTGQTPPPSEDSRSDAIKTIDNR